MANYEIISKKPVSISRLVDSVKVAKKEKEELSYREEAVLNYSKHFKIYSKSKFEDIKKEIEALEVKRLGEEHIVKMIDINPQNGSEIRAIVQNTGVILVDKDVDSIIEILKKYSK